MCKSIMKNNDSLLVRISIIGLIAVVASIVLLITSKPVIIPEMGIFFVMLGDIHNISQVLHKFIEFNEVWYRPLSLYLFPFFVWQVIDMHNILAIKLAAFLMISLNGYIVTELAKTIFNSSFIERVVIFVLVISHPTYNLMTITGDGHHDPMFIIFSNLFLICFLKLLENGVANKIFDENVKIQNKTTIAFLCIIFVAASVLSHERGAMIFFMIFCLSIFYYWQNISHKKIKLEKFTTIIIVASFVIAALYVFFVFGGRGHQSGESYRTGIELQYILPNIVKAFELPLRLMLFKMDRVYDSHNELIFNLFAVPFLLSLFAFLITVFCKKDQKEKNRIIIVLLLFLCALPVPIVFGGGNAWHFFPASIFLSLLVGRSLCYWLAKLNNNVYLRAVMLSIFFMWIAVATVRGINQELSGNFLKFMHMIEKAQNDKTLQVAVDEIPEVVFYDTGEWAENTWPFGGQGKLFRYLYNDPRIIEIALVHGKILESDKVLCKEALTKKKFMYVGFNTENMKWRTIENKQYCL